MNETALNRFWELLGWVFALNPEAFEQINTLPNGSIVALIVVMAASLSQVIGQSIILFASRVKTVRFVLSLLVGAIVFAFGYIFLVLSTWLLGFAPFAAQAPLDVVARTLGFCYAPLIFSIFGAIPYFGEPILIVLSLWQLLAMVVGLAAVSNTNVWQAFETVVLGWVMLWVAQRTIGQPIAKFGQWIISQVAGVDLITKREQFLAILQRRLRPGATNLTTSSAPSWGAETQSNVRTDTAAKNHLFRLNAIASELGDIMIMASVTFAVFFLFSPIRHWWFAPNGNLGGIFQLIFNLIWIGIIAFVAAALLAPIEALGWWAGWYGEQVDTTRDKQVSEQSQSPQQKPISRYVIYLDGIGQSTSDYLPDIQEFLDHVAVVLPQDMVLIKGIMPYSVRNNPLTQNRPLALFWRLADQLRFKNPASLLGYLVNIRNVLVVAVSADRRYGLIYNLGIAQVMYQAVCQITEKLRKSRHSYLFYDYA